MQQKVSLPCWWIADISRGYIYIFFFSFNWRTHPVFTQSKHLDTSKQLERFAFFLFFASEKNEQWHRWLFSVGWVEEGQKNVVILLLAGFSREFCSLPWRMAAHPKGSDTPRSSDPRLPFNADATTRSAFSEKYLISLLLVPSRKGSFLSKCFLRVL